MFVGVGASRVRDLFNRARLSAPCVIFVDELDALGKMRQITSYGGNDEKEQTLNQLLVEMDGFDTKEGIIVLAATNRPEMIDPALLRAGRFDRQILVDRPDKRGREEILKIHLKKTKFDPELDISKISSLTPGFTGADLANLVNEAALLATRRDASSIGEDDFTKALERIIAGVEKKTRLLNPQERLIVATHELGHAMIAYQFSREDKIHKVSIIPHGIGSMGYTIQRPRDDKFLFTENELKIKLLALLGGRAAEIVFFKEASTGASDDLSKATSLATDMITKYGMSRSLGDISFDYANGQGIESAGLTRLKLSEQTLAKIDQEIENLLKETEEKAIKFIQQNRNVLIKARDELIQKETLSEREIVSLFKDLSINTHTVRSLP
jgi:cell division protease FtsH